MLSTQFKAQGRAQYSWYHGDLPVRRAQERVGFRLPYDLVTVNNVERIIAEITAAPAVAVDTETTSLDPDIAKLCCVSFCYGDVGYTVFTNHSREDLILPRPLFVRLMQAIYNCQAIAFFNTNYDFRILRSQVPEIDWYGMDSRIVDVQGLVFLSDTNIWWWTLKEASRFFLGVDPPEFDEEFQGEKILVADPAQICYYASFDAWDTFHLMELFYAQMVQRYGFILKVDNKLQIPLVDYEETPLPVSWDTFSSYSEEIGRQIEGTKKEFWDKFGIINLGSPDKKAEVLRRLGYDTGERTKTGKMSLAIKDLETIKDRCEAAALMIQYAKLVKLQSSYVSPVLERLERGLAIRFKYRHYRVPTYRLAAGSYNNGNKKKKLKNLGYWAAMNVQSSPKPKQVMRRFDFDPETFVFNFHPKGKWAAETGSGDMSFRRGFEVDDDWVWLASDFSAQELAVVTNLSQEPVWIEAFRNGEDLHKKMAIAIWGAENYDKNKRKLAKAANFAIIYGATAWTLAKNLKISEEQANFIVNRLKASVPRLFAWIEETQRQARINGYLVNAYGLPRRLRPYYLMGRKWASFADRSAVNTQVQSCGSVIIRIALRKLWELIRVRYQGDVQFLVTIHDELNLKVRKSRLLEFLADFDRMMLGTSHPAWTVKVGVEHSIGRNWAEVLPVNLVYENGKVVRIEPKAEEAKDTPEEPETVGVMEEVFSWEDESEQDWEEAV